MYQKATVMKTCENKALVAVPRPSLCGDHCASCPGGCAASGHSAWVDNPVHADVGDRVLLAATTNAILKGSAFTYLMPLIILFLAYGVVFTLTNNTAWSTLSALLSLALSLYILHRFDKKMAPPVQIVEILNPDGTGKDESNGI